VENNSFLSNVGNKSKEIFSDAWEFLKGKKRFIAIGAGLLARLIPKHTAVGAGADFISNNLENISIGFDCIAGLFGITAVAEKGIDKYKDIKGLRKNDNIESTNNTESK
jgi:hypothetical protein